MELKRRRLGMNKLNLQLFAEEEVEVEETQEEETQTDKEIDIKALLGNPEFVKYMESHADKRVSSAIAKKDKEYKSQLDEVEKKANMTQEELQADKERELGEREDKLRQYELKLSKLEYFKEKDYDIGLLDFVDGADEESIQANSDKLIEILNKTVEKVVQERLKGKSYEPPTTEADSKMSLDDMNGMSIEQINKMWKK